MATKTKTRWNIDVTADDISRSHARDSYRCVVAQAVARTIPDATRIDVDIQTIRFTHHGERQAYLTPYTVAGYVVAFDAGEEIHPFRFQLRNPIKVRQQKMTTAGRDVARKQQQVRVARDRVTKARETLSRDQSPAEAKAAEAAMAEEKARVARAKADVADARSAYAQADTKLSNVEGRTVPRVHKTKSRSYGHRLLRVNQADDRKHYA